MGVQKEAGTQGWFNWMKEDSQKWLSHVPE
jgi:hypothetical protein